MNSTTGKVKIKINSENSNINQPKQKYQYEPSRLTIRCIYDKYKLHSIYGNNT